MIIVRTPLRISFAGGGSDLPEFYKQSPGAVLSAAIDKYIYISVNPKFDGSIRLSYAKTENVTSASELTHELAKYALARMGINKAIEMNSMADIPGRGTGLGSSSSFTVGLLHALDQYRKLWLGYEGPRPLVYSRWLAEEAFKIEHDDCEKTLGKQDQYAAAFGGLNFFEFHHDGVTMEYMAITDDQKKKLFNNLLLLYTGDSRSSQDILREQGDNTSKSLDNLRAMAKLAHSTKEAVVRGDIDAIGYAMLEGWERKKSLASSVSNPQIDEWHQRAMDIGAIGGKILGAGGGGFLLFYARQSLHSAIVEATGLKQVEIGLEKVGSKVIYMEGLSG